jgi:HSP20 family protein
MSLIRFADRPDLRSDYLPSFFDRIFNEALSNTQRVDSFLPKVDISETEQAYELHVAVPGVNKDDFHLEVVDNTLVVRGERKFQKEEKGAKFHKVETQYGAFSRSFILPEDANPDKVEAQYEDGVLRITLPKDEVRPNRTRISVK